MEVVAGQVLRLKLHKDHLKTANSNLQSPGHMDVALWVFQGKPASKEAAALWAQRIKTLQVMNNLNQEHIVQFITAFRRRLQGNVEKYYMMFEWADGGSLNTFLRWGDPSARKFNHGPDLSGSLLKEITKQIFGLATALSAAHRIHKDTGTCYTHGDLPPENIFIFYNFDGSLRTFKIGNWTGEEFQKHGLVICSSGDYGLKWYLPHLYQAPEWHTLGSREHDCRAKCQPHLYDIWAMGCITLEIIVWFLYGMPGICQLQRDVGEAYWQTSEINGRYSARVHDAAVRWMDRISKDSVYDVGSSVLRDLLDLVKDYLLVVRLPRLEDPSNSYIEKTTHAGPSRRSAIDFMTRMEYIYHKNDNTEYWSPHKSLFHVTRKGKRDESEPAATDSDSSDLDEFDWRSHFNTDTALELFSGLRNNKGLEMPELQRATNICCKCEEFSTRLDANDSIIYSPGELQSSAENNRCEVCVLLWHVRTRSAHDKAHEVRFTREGPLVRLDPNLGPVLTLFQDPTLDLPVRNDSQLGFVELPASGQPTHLEVLRSWLSDCDNSGYHNCNPKKYAAKAIRESTSNMPTRLIDVGDADDPNVFLRETFRLPKPSRPDTVQWIALSHKWGERHFSTTRTNYDSHLQGIQVDELPPTFRDAVRVTRALGLKYLWIDSLCIIQGDDGDFKTEAERMEGVYSDSYCVIAASRATDHYSGFLQPRYKRKYVNLAGDTGSEYALYLCENIDDFQSHVLDGDLNNRGWVLQEHALARRTIFFTEYQTYFECGLGVQCETSTRLENPYAAFLGDPDFPNLLYSGSQGYKISRIQELYKKYSRLGLSKIYDRPVAIDGLQQRLIQTIGATGGFGVLDEGATRGLLRRMLLWIRHPDEPCMHRIDFSQAGTNLEIPSWSWMARTGRIDYLKIGFGAANWGEIQSPWTPTDSRWVSVDTETAKTALFASGRTFDLSTAGPSEFQLTFDGFDCGQEALKDLLPLDSLCVVLGVAQGKEDISERKHYVLIIKPTGEKDGTTVYERIGAGFLPGSCVASTSIQVQIM